MLDTGKPNFILLQGNPHHAMWSMFELHPPQKNIYIYVCVCVCVCVYVIFVTCHVGVEERTVM